MTTAAGDRQPGKRKHADEELRTREERQAFLLELSDALRPLADPVQIEGEACRLLGKQLGADRVYYLKFDAENGYGIVARDYVANGSTSLIGRYDYESYRTVYERVGNGRTWIVADVTADRELTREERERLAAQRVAAWVDVPLLKQGKLVAVFWVVQDAARQWLGAEAMLVEETAERTWAAVERARAEAALRTSEAWLAGQKEALQAAVYDAPLEISLGVLVRTACEQDSDLRCAFYLANGSGTELHHVIGMNEDYARLVEGFKIGADSLSCGLATHLAQPVITADVAEEPLWRPWLQMAQAHDFRACWSFPIQTTAGKAVGTFAMYYREPREAQARDYEFAAIVTRAAAIIISRHRAAEERVRVETALRDSEAQLRQASRAKDEFLAMLGHELRNPLQPIMTTLRLMQLREPDVLT
ncbi:MAG TPA: GAF domain-containing protein, partial [Gammaproteobacteria bacterium]|nr:GAF domain-containing protein [Gammaproteobacteria bacterium]